MATGEHARLLAFYRDLIVLRRTEPDLADPGLEHLAVDYDQEELAWIILSRGAVPHRVQPAAPNG